MTDSSREGSNDMRGRKIFLLVHEDTHFDTEVTPYWTAADAIAAAQKIARSYARDPDDLEEYLNHAMRVSGWIYNASYSPEKGNVRVVAAEIQ